MAHMDFDPQKFFIGLMDFFSILLPGALLTFVVKTLTPQIAWLYEQYNGAKAWVAFLVASYLLGHFAFLLGSWLDEFYDWLRRRTLNAQIEQIVRRKKNFRWWVRAMVWLTFKRESNAAVDRAGKIKEQSLFRLHAKKSINNFQWCKALLAIESPESLAVVQRFEADSKFFRCFVIVLLVMLVWSWPARKQDLAIAAAVLLPLAMWRYMEQRFKATNQAYWSVITLAGRRTDFAIPGDVESNTNLTHAGGVVFRKRWLRGVQFLLVEASKNPNEWVLPKGKIEPGEDTKETAVREVHEETGVWARICEDLGQSSYSVKGQEVRVQLFLMERVARGFRSDKTRRKKWLNLEAATARATHPKTSQFLVLAEERRVKLSAPPDVKSQPVNAP
jgi:8-oxo-dGTP pyrophosphatase MutT (NUDIX family)